MKVPSDRNTSVKVVEKLSKYKGLELEIARMRKMETETIPVVTGALGVIRKGLEKYVDKIPGTASINELQKLLFWEQFSSSERFCQSSELYGT